MAVIAFYIFTIFLLISATAVIIARNPVHSVLCLILCFFNAAGLFILLGAEFIAMLLVIVYVGAVAVLFLFVVMMLNIKPQIQSLWFTGHQWQEFKHSCFQSTSYVLVWCAAMTVMWYTLSWLTQTFIYQDLSLLHVNGFVMPAAIMRLTSFENAMPDATTISTMLMVVSIFFAYFMTARCTKIRLSQVVVRLYQSLPISVLISSVLGLELIITVICWASDTNFATTPIIKTVHRSSNTHALAPLIYGDYMLVFLISGLILLVAMIGAIVLTLHGHVNNKRQNISRQHARFKNDTLEICKVKVGEGIK